MGLHVGSHSTQPRINVTPLVDIVLVLLIIFIVITPAVEAKVQLPKARNSETADRSNPVLLTLMANDSIRVEEPRAQGTPRVFFLGADGAGWDGLGPLVGRSVLIHAEAQRPFRDLQRILDRLRECGAREAHFATAPLQEGGAL